MKISEEHRQENISSENRSLWRDMLLDLQEAYYILTFCFPVIWLLGLFWSLAIGELSIRYIWFGFIGLFVSAPVIISLFIKGKEGK
jgi:fatty-acid desaturase